MFTKQASTVYMIIFGIILANLLLYLVGNLFSKSVAKIVQVKYSYLGPIILVFCFAGAFELRGYFSYFNTFIYIYFSFIRYIYYFTNAWNDSCSYN